MVDNTPPAAGHSARLVTDRATAQRLADALTESFDGEQVVIAAFESGQGSWTVALYFSGSPNEAAIRALVGLEAGAELANALVFDRIEAKDWVAASLEGLAPVEAGRFLVHGRHDRARLRDNRIGIEIEAALAFGTGHHGTTRGCLLALDCLVKPLSAKHRLFHLSPRRGERSDAKRPGGEQGRADQHTPPHPARSARHPLPARGERERKRRLRILDVGTGTGVLAIAAAKALRARVLASDIDPRAVMVARDNARLNRVAPLIEFIRAAGLDAHRFRELGPFDLVLANILLLPLQRLARPMARLLAPGAQVVLSGLLNPQAPAALAAYRAQGLVLQRRIVLDEWTTLVLRRSR